MLIDRKLPSRPQFRREEIMIGDQVFDVWFRDIVQCIKALFSDPDFASILVFAPEKHFTSNMKDVRMYHDMHTGRWWWGTQVSSTCPVIFGVLTYRNVVDSSREG